ncbi:MAG: tetratricopeptide repeat protein, partial [Candidatus Heimdallarchaeaceae archaeon]
GDGQVNESLELAQKILKIHQKSPIPWMLRSVIVLKNGQLKNALVAAEEAVKLEPDNPDTHFNKGIILSNMGRFQEAAIEYKEVFDLSKKEYEYSSFHLIRILEHMIIAYTNSGQRDKALHTAEQALEIASSSRQIDLIEQASSRLEMLKNRVQ